MGDEPVEPTLATRLRRLRTLLVPTKPEYAPSRGRRAWLLAWFVGRRWLIEDRTPGMAAALTIHTLLSTVPLFGLALMVVGLMDPTRGQKLLNDLFRSIVPETSRAAQMAESALELAGNVTISNLGPWGFLVTIAIAFVLFQTLEKTFNRIWRVTRKRGILVKFTMFYTLATLMPLLMAWSLTQPLIPGIQDALAIPFVTTSVGLILLNRFLPFTQLGWTGPIIGGVVSAVSLEFCKIGFGIYVTRFALVTYEGLYGPLAILPVLIVWSYLSWMIVLLGAELSFVVDRGRTIALLGYMNRYLLDRAHAQQPTGRGAARIMLAICDQYAKRELGLTPDQLAERFRIGLDLVGEILTGLEREGFVVEADRPAQVFIPGRPLHQMRLADVIAVFERDHVQGARDERLLDVLDAVETARDEVLGDTTYADLVRAPRPPRDRPSKPGPQGVVSGVQPTK